jgi:transcriptional regulator with XRE-family HTH domain
MAPSRESARALAGRLRDLRGKAGPHGVLTQQQLADALGVSVPLISSWENQNDPTVPPVERIVGYANFFATGRATVVPDLGEAQQQAREELQAELLAMRAEAVATPAETPSVGRNGAPRDTPWAFPDGAPVTIVCGTLPPDLRVAHAYSDPDSPDFVELYSYADLDALFELHGHIRAANPNSDVRFHHVSYRAFELDPDDLTTHLVLLGGVDWNVLIGEVLDALGVPVRQSTRPDVSDMGLFEVDGQEFRPTLRDAGGSRLLVEDVAHFVRGPNPWNRLRTVTICNGNYGRGTYGAVRALTDIRFRDRNTRHVRATFAADQPYSILSRVKVVRGEVITPDWTRPEDVLHVWPKAAS